MKSLNHIVEIMAILAGGGIVIGVVNDSSVIRSIALSAFLLAGLVSIVTHLRE